MSKMEFTFGSLFSGIGGMDLGFEWAGMSCKWQVEIDDFCYSILEKHFPNVKRYRDVKKIEAKELAPVKLIAGGFPCQPHSVAGKRRGAEDDRNLWPDFLRIIEELRPDWVVGENVPGIIPLYLDTVLSDLENQDYSCWSFIVPACAFDARHLRYRVFIVAYSLRLGRSARAVEQALQSKIEIAKGSDIAKFCEVVSEGWDVADPSRAGQLRTQEHENDEEDLQRGRGLDSTNQGKGRERNVYVSNSKGLEGASRERIQESKGERVPPRTDYVRPQTFWSTEPDVGRVAYGIPNRVDRLRALGNAVVPQVAEWFGRIIMETDRDEK